MDIQAPHHIAASEWKISNESSSTFPDLTTLQEVGDVKYCLNTFKFPINLLMTNLTQCVYYSALFLVIGLFCLI